MAWADEEKTINFSHNVNYKAEETNTAAYEIVKALLAATISNKLTWKRDNNYKYIYHAAFGTWEITIRDYLGNSNIKLSMNDSEATYKVDSKLELSMFGLLTDEITSNADHSDEHEKTRIMESFINALEVSCDYKN